MSGQKYKQGLILANDFIFNDALICRPKQENSSFSFKKIVKGKRGTVKVTTGLPLSPLSKLK